MNLERLSSLAEMEHLKHDWDSLVRRGHFNNLFSTWEWQSTWLRHFGAQDTLWLIAAREHGQLVALAPLVQRASLQPRTLQLIGGSDVSDYLDLIVARNHGSEVTEAVFDALWAERGEWDQLDLHCLPAESPLAALLPEQAIANGAMVEKVVEEHCPLLELPGTWDQYVQRLDRDDRHELRRKVRRAQEAGRLEYSISSNPSTIEQDLRDFVRLHRQSSADKAGFMDEPMEAFFLDMGKRLFERGWLRLFFLLVDGRKVATNMCFDYDNKLLLYNSGFDPAFADFSVGMVLTGVCIRYAIEQGREVFDFLRGRETYKYEYGAHDVPIYQVVVSNAS